MGQITQKDLRTAMLLGEQGVKRLRQASVLVFGVGGVGSAVVEALARAGVGTLCIVDHDTVSLSNLNRQIIALQSNVGEKKVVVAAKRIHDIDPEICVHAEDVFLSEQTMDQFDLTTYDFVVDAIDTVSAKVLLAQRCAQASVPLVASMGTGNKLDPAQLRIDDLYQTSGCPLARVMRRALRKLGIDQLTVVWSPEQPRKNLFEDPASSCPGKHAPGSVSFVPPVAGYLLAGYVIRELAGVEQ